MKIIWSKSSLMKLYFLYVNDCKALPPVWKCAGRIWGAGVGRASSSSHHLIHSDLNLLTLTSESAKNTPDLLLTMCWRRCGLYCWSRLEIKTSSPARNWSGQDKAEEKIGAKSVPWACECKMGCKGEWVSEVCKSMTAGCSFVVCEHTQLLLLLFLSLNVW